SQGNSRDRPTRTPSSPSNAGSGAPAGPTPVLGAASDSSMHAEDAWWVWWEFNKLAYLEVRGLERRLEVRVPDAPAEVARLTDPLRRARAPFLLQALQDPEANVRAAAALAFGRAARGEEVLALIPLFEDPSQRVRESALFGLGASGTSEAAQ